MNDGLRLAAQHEHAEKAGDFPIALTPTVTNISLTQWQTGMLDECFKAIEALKADGSNGGVFAQIWKIVDEEEESKEGAVMEVRVLDEGTAMNVIAATGAKMEKPIAPTKPIQYLAPGPPCAACPQSSNKPEEVG